MDSVSAGAIWMVAGLAVAALEMLTPGVFLLWIGIAAILTGAIASIVGIEWAAQIGLFVAITVVLIGAVALRLRPRVQVDTVNAPAVGLIGQTCRAIDFRDGEGRVSLGDGTWSARLADGTSAPAGGQAMRVVGLDGTTLLVAAMM